MINTSNLWETSHATMSKKELSFCHKLWYSNPYNFATQCRRPYIFQTMNSVRSNNHSLKYYRLTPSGFKYIRIRKFEFVATTNFFVKKLFYLNLKHKFKKHPVLHRHILMYCACSFQHSGGSWRPRVPSLV